MLEHALIRDAGGQPIRHGSRTHSHDWDEVQEFCRTVYMPYRLRPLDRLSRPDATMISARAGRVTLTRFSYGTGVYLDEFDPEAGNILVLNTLHGALDHKAQGGSVSTGAGESYVVDCSRTDYWLEGDPDHMQLNLTIPHQLMAQTAERWFGFVPDDALWTRRAKFGGPGSAWLSLLDYAARALTRSGEVVQEAALTRHIEEVICVELLQQWAGAAGVSLKGGGRSAPRITCAAPKRSWRPRPARPPPSARWPGASASRRGRFPAGFSGFAVSPRAVFWRRGGLRGCATIWRPCRRAKA